MSAQNKTAPRIVIVGAGAVGAYTGGYLARGGADVTLIDTWPANVDHMREHGLTLEGVTEEEWLYHARAGTTPVRRAGTRNAGASRHRVCLHEVLRHGVGHHADQGLSRAPAVLSSLCRIA